MTNKEFIEKLMTCREERKVEDTYNEMLLSSFPNINIQYPHNCDGCFEIENENKKLKCILEYKYDYNLKEKTDKCKVISQVIAYLKKFDVNGETIPDVVLIGDINECFVISTRYLIKYLDLEGIDWTIAPSSFFDNVILMEKLTSDEQIAPWVFDINVDFDFGVVRQTLIDFLECAPKLIDINVHNIDGIYRDFETRVIKDKSLNSNDKVQIFMGIITNDENYEVSTRKKNTLLIPKDENNFRQIKIDIDQYNAFKGQFNTNITLRQKRNITSICDRLLEDTSRRLKGEFYTPTPFVDYSHLKISEHLGENWKDEYVVWDVSCGTLNLTRDYNFRELYCSTLEQADLNTSSTYNTNAIKFQYDFLNDDLMKLPDGLVKAFQENRKIVFYFNPPYGTASNIKKDNKESGMSKTKINEEMLKLKYGMACSNLYMQFLYRICKFKRRFNLLNCYICMFVDYKFFANSYKDFRNLFFDNFEQIDNILFNAGHFSNTSAAWGITFSIFKSKQNEEEI